MDFTHFNLLFQPSPMTYLGKTGSCWTKCLTMPQIPSNMTTHHPTTSTASISPYNDGIMKSMYTSAEHRRHCWHPHGHACHAIVESVFGESLWSWRGYVVNKQPPCQSSGWMGQDPICWGGWMGNEVTYLLNMLDLFPVKPVMITLATLSPPSVSNCTPHAKLSSQISMCHSHRVDRLLKVAKSGRMSTRQLVVCEEIWCQLMWMSSNIFQDVVFEILPLDSAIWWHLC